MTNIIHISKISNPSAHKVKISDKKQHVKETLNLRQPTFNSSSENPLPALTFMLYFNVWPWTTGRRGPAVGLGKIFTAFFWRAGSNFNGKKTHHKKIWYYKVSISTSRFTWMSVKYTHQFFSGSSSLVDWTKSWHSFANAFWSVH